MPSYLQPQISALKNENRRLNQAIGSMICDIRNLRRNMDDTRRDIRNFKREMGKLERLTIMAKRIKSVEQKMAQCEQKFRERCNKVRRLIAVSAKFVSKIDKAFFVPSQS